MTVIVYVRLVFVFTRRVLVRVMCVVCPRMVVLVRVHRGQVLYRSSGAALCVVRYMHMLVTVNDFLVIV